MSVTIRYQEVREWPGALLAYVERRIQPEPNTGCWLWVGSVRADGYGEVRVGGRLGMRQRAHRIVYEIHRGPIPGGLQLDHLCRVRCCVNPDHLEAVASRENLLRGLTIPAAHAVKDQCPRGHAYYVKKNGARGCRSCHAAQERVRRAKARAHPDAGGSHEAFIAVQKAAQELRLG